MRKISPPPGFDPQTAKSVASRYTDWAIAAKPLIYSIKEIYKISLRLDAVRRAVENMDMSYRYSLIFQSTFNNTFFVEYFSICEF